MRTINWVVTAFLLATAMPAIAEEALVGFGDVKLSASIDSVGKSHKLGDTFHLEPPSDPSISSTDLEEANQLRNMLRELYPTADYIRADGKKEQISGMAFDLTYGVKGTIVQQIHLGTQIDGANQHQCQASFDQIARLYADKYGKFDHAPREAPTVFPYYIRMETKRSWPDRSLVLASAYNTAQPSCTLWIDYLLGVPDADKI